jgi:signal transduction histidine kinase
VRAARSCWVVVALLVVALFAVGLPAQYHRLVELRGPDPMGGRAADTVHRIEAGGWSVHEYAGVVLALDIALAVGFVALGVLVFRVRGRDPWTLAYALAMVAFGCSFSLVPQAWGEEHPAGSLLVDLVTWSALTGGVMVLLLFPDGRPATSWVPLVVAGYAVWEAARLAGVAALDSTGFAVSVVVGVAVIVASAVRYRRAASSERDQLRWAAGGIVVGLGGFVLFGYVVPVAGLIDTASGSTGALALTGCLFGSLLAIPAGMTVALVRSRLWDVDLVVNRALVYGALSLAVVLGYGCLGYAAARLSRTGGIVVMVAASLVITLVLHPARTLLQRRVNRWMYGRRDDPRGALALLGERLSDDVDSDAALETVGATVQEVLRLRAARVRLAGESPDPPGERPASYDVAMQIVHAGEQVGVLEVATRRGESLGRRERTLLRELAAACGPAVASVRLTRELRRSRERLVVAREAERKRLRDDLHDGVGPSVASLMLQAGALRRRLPPGSELDAALVRLRADAAALVGEIRGLVRGLRPPVLDDRGLDGAVQDLAIGLRDAGIATTVEIAGSLTELPEAVELALYRIVQEACTNVVRHADGCRICLRALGDDVTLSVVDDGCGLRPGRHPGLGLTTMRGRAAELGGRCEVRRRPAGGTEVRVVLPARLVHDG